MIDNLIAHYEFEVEKEKDKLEMKKRDLEVIKKNGVGNNLSIISKVLTDIDILTNSINSKTVSIQRWKMNK